MRSLVGWARGTTPTKPRTVYLSLRRADGRREQPLVDWINTQLDLRQSEAAKAHVKKGLDQPERGQLYGAVSIDRQALCYFGNGKYTEIDRLLIYKGFAI